MSQGAGRRIFSGLWSKLRGKPAEPQTVGVSHPATVDDAVALQAEFERGVERHRQGQLDVAEAIYRSLLDRQPQAAEVLHSMGVLQAQRQRLEDAVVWMGRAAEADPGHVMARVNRGNLLRALGRREEALSSYSDALIIAPGHVDALLKHGELLLALNRPADAIASYDRALTIKPGSVDVLNSRGIVLARLGRKSEALESYDLSLIHI